jgi:hypothetical protein
MIPGLWYTNNCKGLKQSLNSQKSHIKAMLRIVINPHPPLSVSANIVSPIANEIIIIIPSVNI